MQKNLRWKLLFILAILVVCIFSFVYPREKGAGLLSRINLGLDLKGGIHLVLQVNTDDALNRDLNQDADRIAQEFRTKNIPFATCNKGGGYSVNITGIPSSKENEARNYLDSTYNRKYGIRGATNEAKTDFNLNMTASYIRQTREETVGQALETIRRRVDSLGVTEPSLQLYGRSDRDVQDQIIIELPGLDDPDRVAKLIGDTAQLELRLVKKEHGGPFSSVQSAVEANGGSINTAEYQVLPYREKNSDQEQFLVVNKATVITGKDLKSARRTTDGNGAPAVGFYLNSDGAKLFSLATEQHVGEDLAIVLDNVVFSAPRIKGKIDGDGIIEGRFTVQEANDLSLLLRSGALPASLEILQQQTVGASLGNDSIKSGIYASLVGFGLVVIGMIVYYKHSGLNAVWCLLANLIILLGAMGLMGATLTVPGIAGVILAIGMSVDSNILIFERIREEMKAGKTVRAAVDAGFGKVFWTIVDTHVTTLVSALFLFWFGTGPIKGFAVTLTVSLVANMFTAVYVSHRLFEVMLGNRKVEALSI